MTQSDEIKISDTSERKPRDEEIDIYGLTHPGKVREENQDHFLISSLRRHVDIHLTSLPDVSELPIEAHRLAMLGMVADGVGGGSKGEEASRLAVQEITWYVANTMRCYYTRDTADEEAFSNALLDMAMRVHERIAQRAVRDAEHRGMATTLTLWIGVWPRSYLLQVGDSRCYHLKDGVLTQISHDQTMAQEMIDQGVLSRTEVSGTQWEHVLSSSIGGSQTAPVVTRFNMGWGDAGLLCSDGLTKHVSDDQIRERLQSMTSAKQVCEDLLQDALDDGGSDNITVLVARTVRRD
jgi:protein phosphatase